MCGGYSRVGGGGLHVAVTGTLTCGRGTDLWGDCSRVGGCSHVAGALMCGGVIHVWQEMPYTFLHISTVYVLHVLTYTWTVNREPWTVYVTVSHLTLQWHKMNRKCPEYPSSCLLTTDSGKNKVLTGCYFFACLVFSPPLYECICHRFDCRKSCHSYAGIFKWDLISLIEKLSTSQQILGEL